MRKLVPQKQVLFYRLYRDFKERKGEYRPIFEFMGEVFITEVQKWGFMSYEVSARFSELYKENPGLVERKQITGKSGAHYYAYRLALTAKPEMIKDPDIQKFYRRICGTRPAPPINLAEHNALVNREWEALTKTPG